MKTPQIIESVKLEKFVHGGQCISTVQGTSLYSRKKMFVWGGLPGEVVDVKVTKKKSSYTEGIVEKVINPSKHRIEPVEPKSFLSTSPWQIVDFGFENESKQNILVESFEREGIDSIVWQAFVALEKDFGYRNKQEFGFWGDDEGLHLAHFVRGSHGKVKTEGSQLAIPEINKAANSVSQELDRLDIWGAKLKTLTLRSSRDKKVVGALFVKEKLDFKEFKLPKELKGLVIYYSNPKSPASVASEKIITLGDTTLTDKILGHNISYNVTSFFQVNLEVFEEALKVIKKYVGNKVCVDMYSGVGTIGVCVGASVLVESDKANIEMTKANAQKQKVIHASSEKALEYISSDKNLIVDPPRAGLHKSVIERINEVKPQKVIYLSCNPSTQARDVKLLGINYKITYAQGFNFFPRTPHIESLVVLELR